MSLLAGADRAAFVTALGARLRAAGVPVDLTSTVAFTAALGAGFPRDVESLYWTARVTLVHRHEHHATFDAVFDAVFRDAVLATDPNARRAARAGEAAATGDTWTRAAGRPGGDADGAGLPWATRPKVTAAVGPGEDDAPTVPELLPSPGAGAGEEPLEDLDEARLAALEDWLQRTVERWPTRRSRRRRPHKQGRHVALRETLAASRRTGWEPVRLRYRRPERRPRPVLVLVDVSRSMQPYATAYLHLLRVLARTGRCETFVFSTELTRLTPLLRHHSAREARERAEEATADRFGGTHLAGSLRALRRSRHGQGLRGGVLVLASDGWDSDPPEELAAELARLRRRAHRVVWLNPRAAAPGFQPLVGSMAAALPYCDAFLPAHTTGALVDVVAALSDGPGR